MKRRRKREERLAGGPPGRLGKGLLGEEMPELDLQGRVGAWQVNTMRGNPGGQPGRGTEMCTLETRSADGF